jgi:2-hydroxychromene-2-carboxylate isomerase
MTPEKAEILALEGLGWLAGEPDHIEKFLAQAGIDAATLRQAAGEPGTGVAVLDFLLAQDELLVRFCDSAGLQPRQVHAARAALGRDTGFD